MYKSEGTARLIIDRIEFETDHRVIDRIGRTLHTIVLPPKGTSVSPVSGDSVRRVFESFLDKARTHDSEQMDAAAVAGARYMLHAAGYLEIPLARIDEFKKIVRGGLDSRNTGLRTTCYLAVTSIATVGAKTGAVWSPEERLQLQEQLGETPDSENPPIRLIECLGYIADKGLTPRLIELLEHDDSTVRRFAASALGRIGDARAVPALKLLAQSDPSQYANGVYGVRLAANEAIESITKVRTVEAEDKIRIKINRNLE